MSGTLYIVSTPIGNLEDITLRALRILKEVDLIASEDTRTTGKLLSHYDIRKPLTSYHEHNEEEKSVEIVEELKSGKSVAVVSDAGTPGISDPGYRVVRLASRKGIDVIVIPGPSAAVAALSVSGLPTSSFAFLGFLPKSEKKRAEFLEGIRNYPETLVFYESPKRVLKSLADIVDVLGDRQIAVCRELTKMYEEGLRGKASEVLEALKERENVKGEITIVVEGRDTEEKQVSREVFEAQLRVHKEDGLSLRDSVREISRNFDVSKNEVYSRAIKIWEKD